MTDDDHAVRLRDAVLMAAFSHWQTDAHADCPSNTCPSIMYAYEKAIRYHEAKARVEALRQWQKDQRHYMFADVIGQAERALAAIIKEIDNA